LPAARITATESILQGGKKMNEERRQVLRMLAEGRISPEQAEQLLEALEEGERAAPTPRPEPPGFQQERIGGIDLDKLIEMKAVGITPEYIQEIRALLGNVSLDEITEMRAVGVSPDFVREVTAIVGKVPVDKLVEMRAVGVTPDILRRWSQGGFDYLEAQGEQSSPEPTFDWDWGRLRPPRRAEETGE